MQPRPLRPHHRAVRPDRPARPGEPPGTDPPRVLGPAAAGHSRRRAVRAPRHQPERAGRRRLRRHRATAAVVPVRPVSADHRGGGPRHRIREGIPGPPGLARPELGARPADPGRPGADRPRRRARASRAHRLRARGNHQHLPLRPAPDRRGEPARHHRRLPPDPPAVRASHRWRQTVPPLVRRGSQVGSHRRSTSGHIQPTTEFDFRNSPGIRPQWATSAMVQTSFASRGSGLKSPQPH